MVNVRMTNDEKKLIKQGAEIRHFSGISTFMRHLALDESSKLVKQVRKEGKSK